MPNLEETVIYKSHSASPITHLARRTRSFQYSSKNSQNFNQIQIYYLQFTSSFYYEIWCMWDIGGHKKTLLFNYYLSNNFDVITMNSHDLDPRKNEFLKTFTYSNITIDNGIHTAMLITSRIHTIDLQFIPILPILLLIQNRALYLYTLFRDPLGPNCYWLWTYKMLSTSPLLYSKNSIIRTLTIPNQMT